MTNHPPATRADHLKFCRQEGWNEVRNARGKTGSHHLTLELGLPDGRTLRTRISHPPNDAAHTYGPSIWRHILTDQLEISEADFWDCIKTRTPPARASPGQPATETIPADLIYQLRTRARLADSQIAQLSKEEAIEVMRELWAK